MTRTSIRVISFLLLLAAATGLQAQGSTDYLINWEPNPEPDITGYVIYVSIYRNSGFAALDSVDNDTFSYIDQDRPEGLRFFYRIVAKNSSGQRSGFSNPVSAMTIPQDADQALRDSCEITTISKVGNGSYDLSWETPVSTSGFVQFDQDAVLDSMSTWNTSEYALNHTASLEDLEEAKYYARAVAFDEYDNLTISARDSFTVEGESPAPLTTPQLNIYPVPFHPEQGSMSMENLPAGSTVKIYGSNGIEIYSEKITSSDTSLNWEGTNRTGNPVMSGVYYVVIEDSKEKVVSRRPIMIVN